MTFLPGRTVLEVGSADFSDAEAENVSPLAKRLFQTGSVKAVALSPDVIRVARSMETNIVNLPLSPPSKPQHRHRSTILRV